MPHPTIPMRRYTYKGNDWTAMIIASATLYRDSTRQVPTLCHVPQSATHAPERVGVIRVERAWGLQAHELDLGVAPVVEVTNA